MSEYFCGIPKNKFSSDLKTELSNASRIEKTNIDISNLCKLIKCELKDDAIKALSNFEGFDLPEIQTENIEILARINDAKFILGNPDKKNCVQKSVDFYVEIYEQTKDLKYYIRALELVTKAKPIFEHQFPKLKNKTLSIFPLIKSSNYLKLIEVALFLIEESNIKILIDNTIIELDKSYKNNKFTDAKNYITALNKLKYFSNNDTKIQIALCLEKEGDFHISQKELDTYYPNILTIYTDAFRQVKGIGIDESFKTRLEQKITKEQLHYTEMLNASARIPFKSKLNIPELIASQNIKDFKSAFDFLMQLPIIDTKMLQSNNESRNKESFLGRSVKDYIHITNKGTVSGKTNKDSYDLNLSRQDNRVLIISILREIKLIMDIDQQLSKDFVSKFIIDSKSLFIPKERECFFIEGIFCGFKNNFILASHILIPQIENSLKNIIELNRRNTTKLAEEIQNDNMLGSILSIEENNKMLDKICNRDLILELNNFLVDGNGVNFRNRICHGLILPSETDYYGIYLWWLTLKMIKQTNEYFVPVSGVVT